MSDLPKGERAATVITEVRHARKAYGPVVALNDVSMRFRGGEVVGLCGHNGAGKSTLVKLMVGLEQPDSGELLVDGAPVALGGPKDAQRHGIALVNQELSLIGCLSVAQNLVLGDDRAPMVRRPRAERDRCRDLLALVGLEHVRPDTPVDALDIGERQLVEIARLLGRDARLLILDEPTATLSHVEIERVFGVVRRLADTGASVVFVSHKLDEVFALCDMATVMRDGRVVDSRPIHELTKPQLIELMLGEQGRELPRPDTIERRGEDVRLTGIAVPGRVDGFDLAMRGGQIVGLAGQVGSGTSEVLRAAAGLVPEASGFVTLGERSHVLGTPGAAARRGIVYTSNDRKAEGLFLDQTVGRNLTATRLRELASASFLRRRVLRRAAKTLAETVGVVQGRMIDRPVRTLSGGNQQKVLVGRSLKRPAMKLLLLDEPTRGVDVRGRSEIHLLVRQAAASGAAIMIASTELDELLELSDVVVTMFAGEIVSVRPRAAVSASRVLAEMTHATERDTEVIA